MRLHDGRYECVLCGTVLEIPSIPEPLVMIKAASRRPGTRALTLFGMTIHECALDPESHEQSRDYGADPSS